MTASSRSSTGLRPGRARRLSRSGDFSDCLVGRIHAHPLRGAATFDRGEGLRTFSLL